MAATPGGPPAPEESTVRPSIPTAAALAAATLLATVAALAEEPARDRATYVQRYKDPVLEEMEAANDARREAAEKRTEEILAERKAADEQRDDEEQTLRFDLSQVARPAGPDAFATTAWHFPPRAQYLTSTCWSFSTTSFLESEVKRLAGEEVKLSEMWFVYWEYLDKTRGWVQSRGETLFAPGSQSAAVIRVLRDHGAVPLAAYPGVLAADGRFDHDALHDSLEKLLSWCREQGYWEEEVILAMVRRILDRTMGAPPETVLWQGVAVEPREFAQRVCRLDPDAYVDLMSTLSVPFWSRGEYRVPDNWWHGADYVNVPLDDWYSGLVRAVKAGFSVAIGGDVSEPGYNGFEDIAVVPTFDIPAAYIDQDARELRFANGSTGDDHGVHLVGHTLHDGREWFLIKDSARSSRWGKHEGYYMYRDDYVRLKMLTFTVHRDAVADLLARVDAPRDAQP